MGESRQYFWFPPIRTWCSWCLRGCDTLLLEDGWWMHLRPQGQDYNKQNMNLMQSRYSYDDAQNQILSLTTSYALTPGFEISGNQWEYSTYSASFSITRLDPSGPQIRREMRSLGWLEDSLRWRRPTCTLQSLRSGTLKTTRTWRRKRRILCEIYSGGHRNTGTARDLLYWLFADIQYFPSDNFPHNCGRH